LLSYYAAILIVVDAAIAITRGRHYGYELRHIDYAILPLRYASHIRALLAIAEIELATLRHYAIYVCAITPHTWILRYCEMAMMIVVYAMATRLRHEMLFTSF